MVHDRVLTLAGASVFSPTFVTLLPPVLPFVAFFFFFVSSSSSFFLFPPAHRRRRRRLLGRVQVHPMSYKYVRGRSVVFK